MRTEDTFLVQGGRTLAGAVTPSGNKNEALPVLSACLLTGGAVSLANVPLIGDVLVMADILRGMGVRVDADGGDPHAWTVNAEAVTGDEMDPRLFRRLRAAITLAGPLLHRCGKVTIPIPGGDKIGKRRIDTHLLALQQLGAEVFEEANAYLLRARHGLHGADILLDEASVTGTENILMAAVCAKGHTSIYNAACEPHVQQLCRLLNAMGARISGIGANRLEIDGVEELGGAAHTIAPDYIEVGSFIGLAAATGSEITIANIVPDDLRMMLMAYRKLGIEPEIEGTSLRVHGRQHMKVVSDFRGAIPKIGSAPWPGIPADIVSILLVTATQCAGTVLFHEKLFESRLFFTDRLVGMGARIVLCDPHRAVVVGPSPLHGDHLTSPDIRAGVALLIAALCAEGESEIDNVYIIDRGYEEIDRRLNALGAGITRLAR